MRNLKVASLISLINVKSHLLTLKNSTLHKKIHSPRLLISPRLLELCTTSFFQKIPPSMFFSNLHIKWFDNFYTPFTFIPTSTFIREMRVSRSNEGRQWQKQLGCDYWVLAERSGTPRPKTVGFCNLVRVVIAPV